MEHIASSKRGGAVTSEVDKFHLRYLFGVRRCTRARSVRNYSGRWDGKRDGDGGKKKGSSQENARGREKQKQKKFRQKRGRVRPSISAPLITFSHLSI